MMMMMMKMMMMMMIGLFSVSGRKVSFTPLLPAAVETDAFCDD